MSQLNGTLSLDSVYSYDHEAIAQRPIAHPIHPLIGSRRSLRGMSGQPLDDSVLLSLLEAARWAPSRFNAQSWRFVYAKRTDSQHWPAYLDVVNEKNRVWAQDAAVLLVLLSKTTVMKYGQVVHAPSHTFDTGAAWMALALEGTARNLIVHAIAGFDTQKATKMIQLSDEQAKEYHIECMIAIGHRDDSKEINGDTQDRLYTPRIDIEQFSSEGIFKP